MDMMGPILGKIMQVGIFPNLALLFVFYTMEVWKLAKGVLIGALMEEGLSADEIEQECSKCLRCDHYGFGAFKGVSKSFIYTLFKQLLFFHLLQEQ